MRPPLDWIVPQWPAPTRVRALMTTRAGGCSVPPFDSLNLGLASGDMPQTVGDNRAVLRAHLPAEPSWLQQVHGTQVVPATGPRDVPPEADASFARGAGQVCAVLAADCLPVLLCDRGATVVAAAHAGWRGLSAGILERTVEALDVAPGELLAWLGPAIGPEAFEVGSEVREAFVRGHPISAAAFRPNARGRLLANLQLLARQRLEAMGVGSVSALRACTHGEPRRFFSYRRDGITGRHAALIWLTP